MKPSSKIFLQQTLNSLSSSEVTGKVTGTRRFGVLEKFLSSALLSFSVRHIQARTVGAATEPEKDKAMSIDEERRAALMRQITEEGGFAYVSSAEKAAGGDLRAAEAAREMAWEQLHSGPWHEVVPAWRDAYAMACFHVAELRAGAGDRRENSLMLVYEFMCNGTLRDHLSV